MKKYLPYVIAVLVGVALFNFMVFAKPGTGGRVMPNIEEISQRYASSTVGVGRVSAVPGYLLSITIFSTTTYMQIGLYDSASATNPYSGTRIATTTIGIDTAPTTLEFNYPLTAGLGIVSSGVAVPYQINYR